jgi:hypothetical protein
MEAIVLMTEDGIPQTLLQFERRTGGGDERENEQRKTNAMDVMSGEGLLWPRVLQSLFLHRQGVEKPILDWPALSSMLRKH